MLSPDVCNARLNSFLVPTGQSPCSLEVLEHELFRGTSLKSLGGVQRPTYMTGNITWVVHHAFANLPALSDKRFQSSVWPDSSAPSQKQIWSMIFFRRFFWTQFGVKLTKKSAFFCMQSPKATTQHLQTITKNCNVEGVLSAVTFRGVPSVGSQEMLQSSLP